MIDGIKADAVISECGKFRYRLTRTWDEALRPSCFLMLNPSTADAEQDDATIRSCMRLSRAQGAGGIVVVNLYAYRATDPADLRKAGYPVGPENDEHVRKAAEQGHPVIAAWGANAQPLRVWHVKQLLKKAGVTVHCFGVTKKGQPGHPLYVETARELVQFPL